MNKYTTFIITVGMFVALSGLIWSQPAYADGGIIYVDRDAPGANSGASWADAYTSLQNALAVAQSGDEIWVASGVYTPGLARTDTFSLANGVALYGGFVGTETLRSQRDWTSHLTVLSGDIHGDDYTDPYGVVTATAYISGDNAYHVLRANGVISNSLLDGFVVTAGRANGDYPDSV